MITFTAILSSGQRVLANEKIKAIEQKNEGKDWIEELREEIRAVYQEHYIKDKIKAEELSKNKGSGKKIFNEIETGISEKGIYLDFIKNSNAKNNSAKFLNNCSPFLGLGFVLKACKVLFILFIKSRFIVSILFPLSS